MERDQRHYSHTPPIEEDRHPQCTNGFLELNGIPYLLGEYLDRNQFLQIDRSLIRSEIFVDENEAMRAIVDINIDDIGKRGDGYPNLIGNKTKHKKLLYQVEKYAKRLQNRFDVLRRGIVVRVNFRLENQRTQQIIRSTSENFRIRDRHYFLDINPKDINDNGIIVNFTDTLISTMNEFTHGTDRMLLRITSVQLFYECLRRNNSPRQSDGQTAMWAGPKGFEPELYDETFNPYYHHQFFQNRHMLGETVPCKCDEDPTGTGPIYPPGWLMFNRFYRFDNRGKDISLHFQEINDPNNRSFLIPCGHIHVNRSFLINPGHRIIFKFSIWKNDVIAVTNTQRICHLLGVQYIAPPKLEKPSKDLLSLLVELLGGKKIDNEQTEKINWLIDQVKKLQAAVPEDGTKLPCECGSCSQCNGSCKEPPIPTEEECCPNYPDCDCGKETPPEELPPDPPGEEP